MNDKGTIVQQLEDERNNLVAKIQKMQALLERCKALFYDDTEPRLHLSITGDRVDEIYKQLGKT